MLGSTNIDLVAYTDAIPRGGETLTGREFRQSFGGKGANQAVMAARTGVPVSIITGVGDDINGDAALKNFSENDVDIAPSFVFPTTTGVAHIWVEQSGENRIILIPGANHQLEKDEVLKRFSQMSDVNHVIAQCEIPLSITEAVFKAARQRGITTVLNPAPFQELSDELLSNTDFLVVNEIEFQQLHPDNQLPASDEVILSLPFQGYVIVTLGSDGAALVTPTKTITRLTTPKVTAVDTTGAGDALIGAFVAALALGKPAEKALQFSIHCASQSVTRAGAQSSYLTRAECAQVLQGIEN